MEIIDSVLGREIEKITKNTDSFQRQNWTADFHNPNENIRIFKVLSIDKICDYESNFTDEIIIRILIPAGKYSYRIFPFLDNLELTLYRYNPKNDIAQLYEGSQSISNERYVATILNPPASAIEMNNNNQPSEDKLDMLDFVTLDIQLINKAINQLRLKSVGGVFRNCTADQIIKFLLTSESKKVEVSSEYVPAGVDMMPMENIQKRDHILIPQGTRLVDVPSHIQKNCGGVYPAGLSCYFQYNTWYLYPTYNTERFELTPKTLTIINVPASIMPGIEITYNINGDNLVVIATGETKVKDVSEKLLLNEGNGVRFADANKFMETFVETNDNKALASRGRNNSELITLQRDNGDNNVMFSQQRITSNPYHEYSKLAGRSGSIVMMTWENSDPDLIYPGMPVRLKYLDNDIVREIDGVVLKTHHFIQSGREGIFTSRHICTTSIALFVKRSIFKKK